MPVLNCNIIVDFTKCYGSESISQVVFFLLQLFSQSETLLGELVALVYDVSRVYHSLPLTTSHYLSLPLTTHSHVLPLTERVLASLHRSYVCACLPPVFLSAHASHHRSCLCSTGHVSPSPLP